MEKAKGERGKEQRIGMKRVSENIGESEKLNEK